MPVAPLTGNTTLLSAALQPVQATQSDSNCATQSCLAVSYAQQKLGRQSHLHKALAMSGVMVDILWGKCGGLLCREHEARGL